MWAFFRRGHIRSLELNIFKKLLITNFIGLIVEFVLNLLVIYCSKDSIILFIFAKGFLIFFIVFSMLILEYVVVIAKGGNFYESNLKKINSAKCAVCLVVTLITFSLPIYIERGINAYSHGPAVNCIYIYSTIIILLCIGILLKNRKVVREKNYIPLIFYILATFLVAIIQKINPSLTLSTSCDSLLLFVMYFTISSNV